MAIYHLEKITKLAPFDIIPTSTAFGDVDKAYGKEENMKKQILFIQGGSEGAHAVDEDLAKSLRDKLGTESDVRYPKLPEEKNAGYEAWKAQISKELTQVDDPVIVVGHSVGTSMLLKYLSEENVKNSITGIFLLAAPDWGTGGWQVDEFKFDEDHAAKP